MASAGGLPPSPRGLAGDPLAWAWREALPLRLEQPIGWAAETAEVHILPVQTGQHGGEVLSVELPAGAALESRRPLEEAALWLRALLRVHRRELLAEAAEGRQHELIRALKRMAGQIEPDAFGLDLARLAVRLTGCDGAAVASWHRESGRVLAVAGEDGGPQAGQEIAALASEVAVAARGAASILRDRRDRGGLPAVSPEEEWVVAPRSLLSVPLLDPDGSVVGVLAVWSAEEAAIDEEARELLEVLAPYAALQLGHALSFGDLRQRAALDALTGLHNRQAFDEHLQEEAARFQRYQRPLALILFDADHFKDLNDTHGHEAGDEALRTLGAIVLAAVRETDFAGRFGGEELAVLLPETGLDAAIEVAERVRRQVENAGVRWRHGRIPLTVSAGVAACAETTTEPTALVAAADAALYAAKEAGRNRVVGAARAPAGGRRDAP